MTIYQIIGLIWLINSIIINAVIIMDINDYRNDFSFIVKFVNKHNIAFIVCCTISVIISIWLLIT